MSDGLTLQHTSGTAITLPRILVCRGTLLSGPLDRLRSRLGMLRVPVHDHAKQVPCQRVEGLIFLLLWGCRQGFGEDDSVPYGVSPAPSRCKHTRRQSPARRTIDTRVAPVGALLLAYSSIVAWRKAGHTRGPGAPVAWGNI